MTKSARTITALVAPALLACVVNANAEGAVQKQVSNAQLKACVSEIGRRADYHDASRVVHYVSKLDQKNLVELEIRIDTAVYVNDQDGAAREYAASCITGVVGDLVRFRIDPVSAAPG